MRPVFASGPRSRTGESLDVTREALRKRVRQAEADRGDRGHLLATAEREEIRRLRPANEILKAASLFSRGSSTQTCRSERLRR